MPDSEANQFLNACTASRHACTSTTDDTSVSHVRSSVRFARVATRRWTSMSDSFSPAAYASSRVRIASLNTTRAQPNARANVRT